MNNNKNKSNGMKLKYLSFGAKALSLALALSALYLPATSAQEDSSRGGSSRQAQAEADGQNFQPGQQQEHHIKVCTIAQADKAACSARVITDSAGKPRTTASPSAYGPAQFKGAYNPLGATVATNTVIAIVDAYNNPNASSDLAFYSTHYGLKQLGNCAASAGTPTSPCFQKVDQNGGTNYPSPNPGWALESSLDVQAVHALCPDCSILLVEANSNSYADLMFAVDRAVNMGASVVSNSYGSGEFSSETSFDSHFKHPGIAFTFSSGDSGFGASYPAASPWVTAVGGTSLYLNGNNSYNYESAWSGSGSGCSAYEPKPAFQTDSGCARRMIADVSADADPNTGAAVYDTTAYSGQTGWFKVGGTSLASPLVAAIYALSGNTAGSANSLPYAHPDYSLTGNLHDVTSGNNGRCKNKPAYFCNAKPGYDGPTGLGSPNGTGAF